MIRKYAQELEHAVSLVMTRNTKTTCSAAVPNSIMTTNQPNNSQHAVSVLLESNLKIQENLINSLAEMIIKQNEEIVLQKGLLEKQNQGSDKRHNDLKNG